MPELPRLRISKAISEDRIAAEGATSTGWTQYTFMYSFLMAKSYSIASARAKLPEIVDEVEGGKDVEITRRGQKVAVVMSAARFARLRGDRVAFATAYAGFLQEHDLARVGVEPGWSTELRDRDPGRRVKL